MGERSHFFLISTIIAFTIQTNGLKLDTKFLANLIKVILISAVSTLVFAVLIKIAWRLVGGRGPLHSIILTQFYVLSTYALIMCCLVLIFPSLYAIFYSEYYTEALRMTQKGLANFLNQIINDEYTAFSPLYEKYPGLYRLGIMMLGTSCLVSVVWIIAIWGTYRQLNEASRVRSFAAFILCGLFSVPTFGFLFLLIAGGSMPAFQP